MEKIYEWFNNGFMDSNEVPVGGMAIFLFWFLLVITLFVVLLIFYWAYGVVDGIRGHDVLVYGVVIDKLRTPSTESSGVGFGATSSGGTAVVVTRSGSPESWGIIVREKMTNRVVELSTTMQEMYDIAVGSNVEMISRVGGLSKKELSIKLSRRV